MENTRAEFVSIEHHDDNLMWQINNTVQKNDTLVIVGDWCEKKPGKYRQQIKQGVHIFFILGNHDQEAKIRRVFGGNVWHRRVVKYKGHKILCDHHPACYWEKCHGGSYHVYGHIHDDIQKEAMMNLGMPGRRSMDVGVDHARRVLGEYRPWSADEVIAHLSGPGHDIIPREKRWNEKDYHANDS